MSALFSSGVKDQTALRTIGFADFWKAEHVVASSIIFRWTRPAPCKLALVVSIDERNNVIPSMHDVQWFIWCRAIWQKMVESLSTCWSNSYKFAAMILFCLESAVKSLALVLFYPIQSCSGLLAGMAQCTFDQSNTFESFASTGSILTWLHHCWKVAPQESQPFHDEVVKRIHWFLIPLHRICFTSVAAAAVSNCMGILLRFQWLDWPLVPLCQHRTCHPTLVSISVPSEFKATT